MCHALSPGSERRVDRKEYKVKGRTAVTNSFVRLAGGFRRGFGVIGLCFEEARPVVQGVFLLRLLAGAFFAGSTLSYEASDEGFAISLLSGTAVWICATSAAYVYNGVQDVEEDRANGSSRPVARGALSLSHATLAAGALGALGLSGAMLVDDELLWGVAAILLMGWLYSGPPLRLKRFPAAMAAMAVASAVLTYYAGYVVGGRASDPVLFLVFAGIMALWMGLVGQTKDLSDVPGDERARRRSLPVVWGEETRPARRLGGDYGSWHRFPLVRVRRGEGFAAAGDHRLCRRPRRFGALARAVVQGRQGRAQATVQSVHGHAVRRQPGCYIVARGRLKGGR